MLVASVFGAVLLVGAGVGCVCIARGMMEGCNLCGASEAGYGDEEGESLLHAKAD